MCRGLDVPPEPHPRLVFEDIRINFSFACSALLQRELSAGRGPDVNPLPPSVQAKACRSSRSSSAAEPTPAWFAAAVRHTPEAAMATATNAARTFIPRALEAEMSAQLRHRSA